MLLEELIEVFAQGTPSEADQSRQNRTPDSNPWTDLLDEVLRGGKQNAPTPQAGVASLNIEEILGLVLGGQKQGTLGGNPLLVPFTNSLADKLGISPQMASIIVSAAFGLLLARLGGKNGKRANVASTALTREIALDDLVNRDYLKKSGAAEKVARQTGMEVDEAEESLLEALELLGLKKGKTVPPGSQKRSAAPSSSRARAAHRKSGPESDLKHLLDDWEVHG